MTTPAPHPYALQGAYQPSVANVWNDATSAPTAAAPAPGPAHAPAPQARPRHEEPASWVLLKHLMQLAFVASVLLLVTSGGGSPTMALGYAATGLMLMGIMAVSDRQRFADSGATFVSIEFVDAAPAPASSPAPPPTSAPVTRHEVPQPFEDHAQAAQHAYVQALQAHGHVPAEPAPFVPQVVPFPGYLSVT